MIQRCTNPSREDYLRYGALGVTVCERWLKFESFLEDMGIQPKGLQLDRKETHLGYYKENCRWITPTENANNRSNNVLVVFQGQTVSLKEAAKLSGIPYNALWRRIKSKNPDIFRPFV
jgi:hypothetical protein